MHSSRERARAGAAINPSHGAIGTHTESYPTQPLSIPPYSILSRPIPSHSIPSHPITSHPIPSDPTRSDSISSDQIRSYPIPSHPIPSQLILPRPTHYTPLHPTRSHHPAQPYPPPPHPTACPHTPTQPHPTPTRTPLYHIQTSPIPPPHLIRPNRTNMGVRGKKTRETPASCIIFSLTLVPLMTTPAGARLKICSTCGRVGSGRVGSHQVGLAWVGSGLNRLDRDGMGHTMRMSEAQKHNLWKERMELIKMSQGMSVVWTFCVVCPKTLAVRLHWGTQNQLCAYHAFGCRRAAEKSWRCGGAESQRCSAGWGAAYSSQK